MQRSYNHVTLAFNCLGNKGFGPVEHKIRKTEVKAPSLFKINEICDFFTQSVKCKSRHQVVVKTLNQMTGKGNITTKFRYTFATKTATKPPKKR